MDKYFDLKMIVSVALGLILATVITKMLLPMVGINAFEEQN